MHFLLMCYQTRAMFIAWLICLSPKSFCYTELEYTYIMSIKVLVSEGFLVGMGHMLPVIGLGIYVISSID